MRPIVTLALISAMSACATATHDGAPEQSAEVRSETVTSGSSEVANPESGRKSGVRADGAVLISAMGETSPVESSEDAADDPAIWLNRRDAEASLVLGTDKQAGLYIYNMSGTSIGFLPVGQLNNVDLRQGGPGIVDIAVASNDSINAVSVFAIDRDAGLVTQIGDIPTGLTEPYGICLGQTEFGYLPVVTYKDGTVQAFAMIAPSEDDIDALVRGAKDLDSRELFRTRLDSQLEGCVVDEFHNRIFVGEEAAGVWSIDLDDVSAPATPVDMISDGNGLVADVEGMSLWRGADGKGWLVVSAQEADRFVVYDREAPHTPRGTFAVGDLRTPDGEVIIDAISHTDGLDVRSAGFGARFPRGFLAIQDDENTAPEQNQNYKYVDWRRVEKALNLPILDAE